MKAILGALVFLSTMLFATSWDSNADSASRLFGNHPVGAEQRFAIGNMDATAPLAMEIHLKLRNQPQLQTFLDELQDPGSPNFHKFLQPGEFDRLYAPHPADVAAVAKWLREEGFTVTATSGSVQFTGTVEQAGRAFAVHILKMSANEYANIDDPILPADLATMVGDIEGLDNLTASSPVLRIPPNLKKLSAATAPSPAHILTRREAVARVTHAASPLTQIRPDSIGDSQAYGDTDLRNTYNVPTSATMGSGDCIAIVGSSDFLDASLTTFASQFSDLPPFDVTRVVVGSNPGIVSGAAETEADLDLEWSHVIAPGAPQHFYVGGLLSDITQAVNDDTCKVISISYEFCSAGQAFYTATLDPIFMKAASQGQSVFISTGDHGAAGSVASDGHCVAGSADPVVNEMSADPNVTAVGGTQILAPEYDNRGIAQGYSTETVWNDAEADLSANGATGGGASSIFSKPGYQRARGVPNDGKRDVPDVVLLGGSPAVLIGGDSSGASDIECCVDGTSLATPLWAGLAKDIESDIGALGLINPKLYALGTLQYGTSATNEGFHDITSGDNSFNGVKGFSAGPGYDKASGLGSVDFNTFKTAFEADASSPPPILTVTPTPNNFGSFDATSVSRPKKFTVANTGAGNAIIGTVATSGANTGDFKIISNGCRGRTVKPKHSCVVTMEFAPALAIGAESASLNVPYNGGTATGSLAGTSTMVMVPPDRPTITVPPTDAGQTSAPTEPITFTNASKTVNVTLGSIPSPSVGFAIASDTCSKLRNHSLGHGKRCKITVVAKPPLQTASDTTLTGGLVGLNYTYGANIGQAGSVGLISQVILGTQNGGVTDNTSLGDKQITVSAGGSAPALNSLVVVAIDVLTPGGTLPTITLPPSDATHPPFNRIAATPDSSFATMEQFLYWKVIGSGETGAAPFFSFGFNGSTFRATAVAINYNDTCTEQMPKPCPLSDVGVTTAGDPIAGSPGIGTSVRSNSVVTLLPANATVPNGVNVTFFGTSNTSVFLGGFGSPNGAVSPPTLLFVIGGSGFDPGLALYDQIEPMTGSLGTISGTLPNNDTGDNIVQTISIVPK